MQAAAVILWMLGAYAAIGALFAATFVIAGAGRIDPAARHAGWGFRVLIFPGAAALWPFLMLKWRRVVRGQGARP